MSDSNLKHLEPRIQYILLTVVFLIGVGGTALGALNIRSNILSPFDYKGPDNLAFTNTLQAGEARDTDGDGLSDADELSSYGTSPYLDDSDSDGVKDGDEIQAGTDPNCPRGQDCGVTTTPTTDSIVPLSSDEPIVGQTTLSIDELRTLLEQGGMSSEQVAGLSDEDIYTAYTQASQGFSGGVPAPAQSTSVEDLKNLSPTQVRALMVSQGIDLKVLEGVSDEELMKLYLQSIESAR